MIRRFILTLSIIMFGSTAIAVSMPQTALACSDGKILTLVPWYQGLTNSDCTIKNPDEFSSGSGADDGLQRFIGIIVLNIVEDIFQISGYIAAGFVMYGGFLYLTSAGAPDQATRGRKTIINSVIGIVVVIGSVAIVNWFKGSLGI